jgi:hypothetical protein
MLRAVPSKIETDQGTRGSHDDPDASRKKTERGSQPNTTEDRSFMHQSFSQDRLRRDAEHLFEVSIQHGKPTK